jgi:hypothetical protein
MKFIFTNTKKIFLLAFYFAFFTLPLFAQSQSIVPAQMNTTANQILDFLKAI